MTLTRKKLSAKQNKGRLDGYPSSLLLKMVNFNNTTFVKSVSDYSLINLEEKSEVLILGKSNVGKSSLINALTNHRNLAKTSSKPGRTKLLNYFNVDNRFYLIDAPGYGYATGGVDLDKLFKSLMDGYFAKTKNLKLVLLLFNSERTLSEGDEELLTFLKKQNIKYILIFTKGDKLNQKERNALEKYIHNLNENNYILCSKNNINAIYKIQKFIDSNI